MCPGSLAPHQHPYLHPTSVSHISVPHLHPHQHLLTLLPLAQEDASLRKTPYQFHINSFPYQFLVLPTCPPPGDISRAVVTCSVPTTTLQRCRAVPQHPCRRVSTCPEPLCPLASHDSGLTLTPLGPAQQTQTWPYFSWMVPATSRHMNCCFRRKRHLVLLRILLLTQQCLRVFKYSWGVEFGDHMFSVFFAWIFNLIL